MKVTHQRRNHLQNHRSFLCSFIFKKYIYRMTEMNNQQQIDKYIETTSEFIKRFSDYVKKPQKKNE